MLNRKKIDLTKYQIGEQAIQTIHKMHILFEKLFLDWELFCYMFLVISAFCSNSQIFKIIFKVQTPQIELFSLMYVSADLKAITFLNSWFAIFIFLLLLQAEEAIFRLFPIISISQNFFLFFFLTLEKIGIDQKVICYHNISN